MSSLYLPVIGEFPSSFNTQKLQQLEKLYYYCTKIAIKVGSRNIFLLEEHDEERKDYHEDFERFSCGGITEV